MKDRRWCRHWFSGVEGGSDWVTCITSDIPTDHSLHGKDTLTTIGWYVNTSDIGVVGGSGAAATV